MLDKQTILIVDDVSENVDILVKLLQKHDLVTAVDGKSALDIVKEEDIDLILLDVMMPEMDGFEVCRRLKNSFKTSHIPIIFLTAKDNHKDMQQGFKLGAVDYITKPFNPDELLARVATHLKLRAYEKNLEKRVNEEFAKNRLKEQMIHQQSKQAALGELLMHIAHQWKQPLAALGSINLLQKTKLLQNQEISKEELMQKIEKSENLITFMSETVNTFRNFYRPNDTRDEFLITDVIEKVLSISDATLNYDNIRICLTSTENTQVNANENEFGQVLFSIINNARDIFRLRETQAPSLEINVQNNLITIADNGGGVDEEIIDEIFLPFTSTTKGNGIGLYIAKEIIEKNSALISVQNSAKGAVFKVEFLTWLN
jgi:two-component system sensor histidine kinase/response regulator